MLRGGAEARAEHGADHHRRHGLAAEHVPELGGLVEDLVEADAHEVDEHQFGDRPQPGGRGTDGRADERDLGDSGVSSTPVRPNCGIRPLVTPSAPPQASCSPVAAGAAGDVLAHDDDASGRAPSPGAAPR